jgi:PAS domain S-box-containing protein
MQYSLFIVLAALTILVIATAVFYFRRRRVAPDAMAHYALVESMSDGMLALDEQGRVIDLNRAAQDTLGVSLASVRGQPVEQALSRWPDLVDHFRDKLAAQAEISLGQGEAQRYYDLRISPLTDSRQRLSGRLIIWRDITARKRAESALGEREEQMRQITSSMREAVWLRDAKTLQVLYVNPAYEEIWGRACDSLYQNPASFLDAVHPDDKPRLMEAIQKQYAGVPFNQEYRIIRPDGRVRWIWGRTFLIKNESGELYRATAIAEDITDRKQAEAALLRSNAELQARNLELDAFGETAAHDLKSPLAIMTGYADTLREYAETLSPGEVRRSAEAISRVGAKMDRIIEELMILAGLRKARVSMEPLDMATIVAEARHRVNRMMEDYQAELYLPNGDSAWPAALGYAPWAEEVWVNYLNNAIKYGGRPPRVEVGATRQPDGKVRFWVRDNGNGIPSEAQTRVFNSFERLDRARATGYGLGLSIVRRIVERMDGQVGVESDGVPGKGSTFYFTLPTVSASERS